MGLLIVNADDFGGWDVATDAIASCFAAGAITSTTFMVHMADSARAADLAEGRGWPLGLHLNLTQPFNARSVPETVRERQRALCAYFTLLGRRRRVPEVRPRMRRTIRDAVADQLDAFTALHGREPTHIDSHQHVHTAPSVLAALPPGFTVRRTASRRGALIAQRFATTDRFLSFPAIEEAAAAAATGSVELMVHPSFDFELPVLLSEDWLAAMAAAPTGSFRDVDVRPPLLASLATLAPIERAAALLTQLPA